MDVDLDDLYADELQALEELDENIGYEPSTKSKKSLDFSTPSTKQPVSRLVSSSGDGLDDSFAHALEQSIVEDKDDGVEKAVCQTNKRCQEDLFGGISDDEKDMEENGNEELPDIAPSAKRRRIGSKEKENYAEKTGDDQISNSFKRPIPFPATTRSSDSWSGSSQARRPRQRVHRRIPQGAFIPSTSDEGQRFYMSLKSEETLGRQVSGVGENQQSQLLGVPIQVLKQQIDEQNRLSAAKDKPSAESTSKEDDVMVTKTAADEDLWVEKYSPKCYTDLLSDEGTNRTLLRWLKQWDYVVFDKEKKPQGKKDSKKGKETKEQTTENSGKKPYWVLEKEALEMLDDYDRPINKVVLLHGPPGLGKTTLAHVLARHAGYNVIEMNASDDRTADIFQTKIESATQMKAVLTSEQKPNCLVIDEIDGAPQAAINVLLSAIKGEKTGKKKKGKKEFGLLLRPIICICNDLYVPSLRQLRALAFVVHFPLTKSTMLAGRLLEISKYESMRTDLSTLLVLCEKTDNDIRSCLNTLQFVRGQRKDLSLNTVHSMGIGQKDSHKTLMAVCNHVFQMPKPKRKRYINPYDRAESAEQAEEVARIMAQNSLSLPARFDSTLNVAIAAGEHDKVLQGLYENFLETKIKDPLMDSVLLAEEWVCFSDIVSQRVAHTQDYILWAYLPYLPVLFHLLFASTAPPKMMYPKAQYEMYVKSTKSENLLSTLLLEMAPSVRRNANHLSCATELLPPLLDIIQPTLRPVNTQLYSSREKEDLHQLILIMIACNLTYMQQRGADGQYSYSLEPNLEEVVRFPGQKPRRQFSYASKQLVAREVELEKMRRSERSREDVSSKSTPKVPPGVVKQAGSEASTANVPNFKRQSMQPKALSRTDDRPDLDFFGRQIVKTATSSGAKQDASKDMIKSDVWFRFKEGYTNAVRKTVRIQDFF